MIAAPTAPRSYRWLFWLLALCGFTVDQVSKYVVFARLYNEGHGDQIVVIPGAFHVVARFDDHVKADRDALAPLRTIGGPIQPHVNRGALFGIGQGNNIFFGLVSVAAAGFILTWSTRPAAGRDAFLCIALGFILGGTLGNLYDRLVFEGVRDFFHWYRWYDWPVFNVADVCLVGGACMLLLEAFWRREPAEEQGTAMPAEVPAPIATTAADR